jgi:VanZ family protein
MTGLLSPRRVEGAAGGGLTVWGVPITAALRAVWLFAAVAVIVGSLLPSNSRPIRMLESIPLSDKAEHLGMYAVLSFIPAIHERRRVMIAAAVLAAAMGVALEFAQLASGWREFEIGDMVADTVGVCLGFLSGIAIRMRVLAWRL